MTSTSFTSTQLQNEKSYDITIRSYRIKKNDNKHCIFEVRPTSPLRNILKVDDVLYAINGEKLNEFSGHEMAKFASDALKQEDCKMMVIRVTGKKVEILEFTITPLSDEVAPGPFPPSMMYKEFVVQSDDGLDDVIVICVDRIGHIRPTYIKSILLNDNRYFYVDQAKQFQLLQTAGQKPKRGYYFKVNVYSGLRNPGRVPVTIYCIETLNVVHCALSVRSDRDDDADVDVEDDGGIIDYMDNACDEDMSGCVRQHKSLFIVDPNSEDSEVVLESTLKQGCYLYSSADNDGIILKACDKPTVDTHYCFQFIHPRSAFGWSDTDL